jgi:predicted nucleotidyltransferase
MKSKENVVLELFFNHPTKRWHFEGVVKETKLSRGKVDKWLKVFIKLKIINKVKEKKKMPYYIGNYESPIYINKKKMFALNKIYDSGLLNHLSSLDVQSVIIFGSLYRGDWDAESDLDIFIYGHDDKLNLSPYQIKLHREIQLFNCKNEKCLKKYGGGLLRNIIKGINIKGDIPLEVIKHAAVQ